MCACAVGVRRGGKGKGDARSSSPKGALEIFTPGLEAQSPLGLYQEAVVVNSGKPEVLPPHLTPARLKYVTPVRVACPHCCSFAQPATWLDPAAWT